MSLRNERQMIWFTEALAGRHGDFAKCLAETQLAHVPGAFQLEQHGRLRLGKRLFGKKGGCGIINPSDDSRSVQIPQPPVHLVAGDGRTGTLQREPIGAGPPQSQGFLFLGPSNLDSGNG